MCIRVWVCMDRAHVCLCDAYKTQFIIDYRYTPRQLDC